MSLNDPFGRVARRTNNAYCVLRERLQRESADDPRAAENLLAQMWQVAVRVGLSIIAGSALLAIVVPSLAAAWLILGALLLAWLGGSYLQTRGYVKKYLRERDDHTSPAAAQTPRDPQHEESDHD